jgi:hypothetical protein
MTSRIVHVMAAAALAWSAATGGTTALADAGGVILRGNAFTRANADLRAERMKAVEAGALVSLADRARLRANLFWMDLDQTVANVTLSTEPGLITRQDRTSAARSRAGWRWTRRRAWAVAGPSPSATCSRTPRCGSSRPTVALDLPRKSTPAARLRPGSRANLVKNRRHPSERFGPFGA